MATFKRLTHKAGWETYVNLDRVQTMTRQPANSDYPEYTRIWFSSSGSEMGIDDYTDVLEEPMKIVEQGL